jgi:hypothetical protein
MATKLTRLTHKKAIQLHLVAVPSEVLAPDGWSGNFWIHSQYQIDRIFKPCCIILM